MPFFLLYLIYSLFRWSERSGKRAPIIGVVYGLALLSFFNVVTVFSLAQAALGRREFFLALVGTTKLWFLLGMLVWCVIIYGVLVAGNVREKAFSTESMTIYAMRKYSANGAIIYLISSFLSFVFALWLNSR
jgi:hypothetical protein